MFKLVLAAFLFCLSSIVFSLQEAEKVVAVEVNTQCIKTFPCQHQLIVTYEGGEKVEKTLDSSVIAERYWDFLPRGVQEHLLSNPSVYELKIDTF
jgi:hypothetical protein